MVDLLESLETGDTTAARVINPDRYTQHNPRVSDGLPGFLDAVGLLSTKSAKVHLTSFGSSTQIPAEDRSELRITFEHAVHSAMPPDTSIL